MHLKLQRLFKDILAGNITEGEWQEVEKAVLYLLDMFPGDMEEMNKRGFERKDNGRLVDGY